MAPVLTFVAALAAVVVASGQAVPSGESSLHGTAISQPLTENKCQDQSPFGGKDAGDIFVVLPVKLLLTYIWLVDFLRALILHF